ncbi:hypothetical protein SAMN05518855_1002290 [Paenibacillus sp. CF384]|nr:hypothetical protein SAMN05518855_1002290 [Paenibacillus sp. CF384]
MVINKNQICNFRYGSPDSLPERCVLRSGPLTAILEDGRLWYILNVLN